MTPVKSPVSLAIPLFFCSSVFFFFLCCNAADQAMIDNICKKTQDYDFCAGTFAGDPRTEGATNEKALAMIIISQTIIQIQNTLGRIPDILKSISDEVGQQRLGFCKSDYEGALGMFENAFGSTDKQSYWDSVNFIRQGAAFVTDCKNIYLRDPVADSPLAGDNSSVFKLTGIAFQIFPILTKD